MFERRTGRDGADHSVDRAARTGAAGRAVPSGKFGGDVLRARVIQGKEGGSGDVGSWGFGGVPGCEDGFAR